LVNQKQKLMLHFITSYKIPISSDLMAYQVRLEIHFGIYGEYVENTRRLIQAWGFKFPFAATFETILFGHVVFCAHAAKDANAWHSSWRR
jgi:hypothetical protein